MYSLKSVLKTRAGKIITILALCTIPPVAIDCLYRLFINWQKREKIKKKLDEMQLMMTECVCDATLLSIYQHNMGDYITYTNIKQLAEYCYDCVKMRLQCFLDNPDINESMVYAELTDCVQSSYEFFCQLVYTQQS